MWSCHGEDIFQKTNGEVSTSNDETLRNPFKPSQPRKDFKQWNRGDHEKMCWCCWRQKKAWKKHEKSKRHRKVTDDPQQILRFRHFYFRGRRVAKISLTLFTKKRKRLSDCLEMKFASLKKNQIRCAGSLAVFFSPFEKWTKKAGNFLYSQNAAETSVLAEFVGLAHRNSGEWRFTSLLSAEDAQNHHKHSWMGDTSHTKNWWWPTLWIVDENRCNLTRTDIINSIIQITTIRYHQLIQRVPNGPPPSKEWIHRLMDGRPANHSAASQQPWQPMEQSFSAANGVPKCWVCFSFLCIGNMSILIKYSILSMVSEKGRYRYHQIWAFHPHHARQHKWIALRANTKHTFQILPAQPCHCVWKTGKNKQASTKTHPFHLGFETSPSILQTRDLACNYVNSHIIYIYNIHRVRLGPIRFS